MVMIRRITAILFLVVSCTLQCAHSDLQYFVPQRIIPVQTSPNNQRLCCPIYPQQQQTKQVFVWYGTSNGDGQRTAGIFSNVSTIGEQSQQYPSRPTQPPPQSNLQGFTSEPSQPPLFYVTSSNEPVYPQGSSTPFPISGQGNIPQSTELTIGRQNDFGPSQLQPTTIDNDGRIQPTSTDREAYNNQFQLVTPDIGAYNNQYQPINPPGGSYNSANAGYQVSSSNSPSNNEFNLIPNLIPITPVTPIPNSYNEENGRGVNGQSWEISSQFYNDGSTIIPNQSGIVESERPTDYATMNPNNPNRNGIQQMQSSTPPNYVVQQQWSDGYGLQGLSGATVQSDAVPNYASQEQGNGGYISTPPPIANYPGSSTSSSGYVISSTQSTVHSPQPIQETFFSSDTPNQSQEGSYISPYNNPNFDTSTSRGNGYFDTTQPSSSVQGQETASTPFQYSTQHPFSIVAPVNVMPSTSRPYNGDSYSPQFTDRSTIISSSPTPYGENVDGAYVAPSVQQFPGSDSLSQRTSQISQPYISSTGSPQVSSSGYTRGERIIPVSIASSSSSGYGQNAEGVYVQPISDATQYNFNTAQQTSRTTLYGPLNEGMGTSQIPYAVATGTVPPSGPQYDFQHNMNTVYGNYDNWPSKSANHVTFTVIIAILAFFV